MFVPVARVIGQLTVPGGDLGICQWGLQRNIQSLNLTHNRLSDLDHHLSTLTHLRILDISYNRLLHFPASMPRALWEINISGNRLRVLNKDDTAYQWNLRVLDLSVNKLDRVVFINNTLPNLKALNLSHNKFWTVPTNMPQNLEEVDISHNTLVQILPGSLKRLHRLARLYLHANRFTTVRVGAFEASAKSEAHHSRGQSLGLWRNCQYKPLIGVDQTHFCPSVGLPLPHLAHLRRGSPVQDRELALWPLHTVPICLWKRGAKPSICTSSHHTLLVGDLTPKHQGWPDRI